MLRGEGIEVHRRDLVLSAANKDGGAHVDAALDATYSRILEGAGWSITVNPPDEPPRTIPFKNAHVAALRQIAYEVLNSPDVLKLLQ